MERWNKKRFREETSAQSTMPASTRSRPNLSCMERLRIVASHMELPTGRKPKTLPLEEVAALAAHAGVTLPGKSLEGDISFLEDYTLREINPMEASVLDAKINTLVKATIPSSEHASLTNNGERLDAIARQLGLDVDAEQAKSHSCRVSAYIAKLGIK